MERQHLQHRLEPVFGRHVDQRLASGADPVRIGAGLQKPIRLLGVVGQYRRRQKAIRIDRVAAGPEQELRGLEHPMIHRRGCQLIRDALPVHSRVHRRGNQEDQKQQSEQDGAVSASIAPASHVGHITFRHQLTGYAHENAICSKAGYWKKQGFPTHRWSDPAFDLSPSEFYLLFQDVTFLTE